MSSGLCAQSPNTESPSQQDHCQLVFCICASHTIHVRSGQGQSMDFANPQHKYQVYIARLEFLLRANYH